MDEKDFVPYETAKKLKAAGYSYPIHGVRLFKNAQFVSDAKRRIPCAPLIPLWQAMRWLREECGLHVDVGPYSDCSKDADGEVCDRWDFWGFDIYEVTGGKRLTDDDGEYDSYEAALSAGIDAALDLITNKTEEI